MFKTRKMKLMAMMVSASLAMAVFAPTVSIEAAGKQTMYVVTSTSGPGTGDFRYTYDKNGLLNKTVVGSQKWKYTYDGNELVKKTITDSLWKEKTVNTYQYDDENRVKAVKSKVTTETRTEDNISSYSYDSNDRVKKIVTKVHSSSAGDRTDIKKFTYNGQGLPVKVKGVGYTYQFEYDERGNQTKFMSDGETTTCQNTYDQNGCLARVVWSDAGDGVYTYKKVKVPAKYVETVQMQQWEILNSDASPNILY